MRVDEGQPKTIVWKWPTKRYYRIQ